MSYFLYGRLRGRGRELTASGTKAEPMYAQLETRNAGIRITLRANGEAEVEVSRKDHDTAYPNGWKPVRTFNIDEYVERS